MTIALSLVGSFFLQSQRGSVVVVISTWFEPSDALASTQQSARIARACKNDLTSARYESENTGKKIAKEYLCGPPNPHYVWEVLKEAELAKAGELSQTQ